MIQSIAMFGLEGTEQVGAGIQPAAIPSSEESNRGHPRNSGTESISDGRGGGCQDVYGQ